MKAVHVFVGLIVLVIVGAVFWAAGKHIKKSESTPTPSVAVSRSDSPLPVRESEEGDGEIGNAVGDKAPDFRLKDVSGTYHALRDYQNREAVKLVFTTEGQVVLNDITLLDPQNTVRRLYDITVTPTTVTIDINGIIVSR